MDAENISNILEQIRIRSDFGGLTISANYASIFPPFSWVDSEFNIRGVFKDTLEVIANKLNLTFALKKSTEENMNVWFTK